MREVEQTIYRYSELSEKAQEKAYNDFLCDGDYPFGAENRETLKEFETTFPIKVKDWEYGYNFYATVDFIGDVDIAKLSGIRLLKYLVNNYWDVLYRPKYYYIPANSKCRHSKCQYETGYSLTGFWTDNIILKPISDFMENPNETTFEELLIDCVNMWLKACSEDYIDYFSMEHFEEICAYEEWEFYEDGSLFTE